MEPGLGPGAAAPRALCRWGPWPLPHIPPGRGPGLLGPPGLGVCSGTCADCLPAHGERGPGLNDVHGDGAVVVRPGPPGELSRGVCNLIYGHSLGGTWRAWKSKTLRVGVHWLHTPWTGRLSPALVITEHPLGAGSSASPEPQAGQGYGPAFWQSREAENGHGTPLWKSSALTSTPTAPLTCSPQGSAVPGQGWPAHTARSRCCQQPQGLPGALKAGLV